MIGQASRIQQANWQIMNITSPANYFHMLRRQVWRDFRKPLVMMSPKSLLRHRLVKSDIDDFLPGTSFKRLIPETGSSLVADEKVRKLVLCTGKVYFDLLTARDAAGMDDVAIGRIEQIAPFPHDLVQEQVQKYASPPFPTSLDPTLSADRRWYRPAHRPVPPPLVPRAQVPECRGGVVPGGAQERGRVVVRAAAHRDRRAGRARDRPRLRGPQAGGVDGDGLRLVAHQGDGRVPQQGHRLSSRGSPVYLPRIWKSCSTRRPMGLARGCAEGHVAGRTASVARGGRPHTSATGVERGLWREMDRRFVAHTVWRRAASARGRARPHRCTPTAATPGGERGVWREHHNLVRVTEKREYILCYCTRTTLGRIARRQAMRIVQYGTPRINEVN